MADGFPPVDQLPARTGLPDPLVMLDGTPVTTKEQWIEKRRPQLKALFQHYMYGYFPKSPVHVSGTVTTSNKAFLGGKATMQQVTLSLGPKDCPPIHLLLVVPNDRKGPAPVILGLNFNGNHSVHSDPSIHLPTVWMRNGVGVKDNKATDEGRGKDAGRWEIENTIDQGYAVATFYYGDVLPDKADLNDGVLPYFRSTKEADPLAWRAIAAWAWGLHRAVDYLLMRGDVIDGKRIVCFGHSRNGKAALVAAAFDERIALAIPHQAGCGGTAPSRTTNPKAETVKRINTVFPHWFNENFKKFNDEVNRLPFDQHCLVALCAPRPVLFTNGDKDQWADPAGQFDMLKAADPVYKLLGVGGLASAQMPELGELSDGKLGYYIVAGPHTVDKNYWNIFIAYAKKQLGP
jgi:hypothetical protein